MVDRPPTTTDDLRTIIDENGDWKLYATEDRLCAISTDCTQLVRAYMTDSNWNPVEVEDNLSIETVIRRYINVSGTTVDENELYDEAVNVFCE